MKKTNDSGSVLIVAAHPDDEVLGCGGLLARLAQEGRPTFAAILSGGVAARYSRPEDVPVEEKIRMRSQARQASEFLGLRETFFFDLPDNRFDSVPLLDIIKLLEGLLKKIQPVEIFVHHSGDLNIDHQAVNLALLTAARPLPGSSVRQICTYEIPSATGWAFQARGPDFRPNLFVDITETIHLKLEAFRLYQSELREFPHPRSLSGIEAAARYWGAMVGLSAAEPFQIIRAVA